MEQEKLPLTLKLCFGAPSFAGAAMAIPIAVHMPRFYSDVVLAPLGAIALAIAVARAFDALTDPLMGWLSDRTHSRWGRRKPFIALGVPLCALCFWALFAPPPLLSGHEASLWFGASFGLYFLFHTVYAIPHAALGAEVSLDYHGRSALFGVHASFVAAGTIFASVLPGVLEDGFGISDERRVFMGMAAFYAVLLIVLYALLLLRVPERPEFVRRRSNPLIPGVRRALRNGPFRILLFAGIAGAVPAAIPATLIPYFVYYVIRPASPATWLSLFLLLYLGSGFLFLPVWMSLARRIGKLRTLVACSVIGISGSVLFFWVGPGDTLLATAIYAYTGLTSAAFGFLIPAMGADVIDYDELRTGKRREAQFASFWAIIPKFVAIPGSSIPIAILSAAGYVPNQAQTPEVILVIRFLYAIFPAAFYVASLLIVLRYPISEAIHRSIRAGIDAHERGEVVEDPLTGERLPPATARGVDEKLAWFLDTFSPRELESLLRRGAAPLTRRVLRACGAWLSLSGAAVAVTVWSVSGWEREPAPVAVVAVVVAGLALTAFLFHAARLGPARRMARRPPPDELIRLHLGEAVAARSAPLRS
jgi:GPH family glycoside/pentoside/hexuronide:cation symporter